MENFLFNALMKIGQSELTNSLQVMYCKNSLEIRRLYKNVYIHTYIWFLTFSPFCNSLYYVHPNFPRKRAEFFRIFTKPILQILIIHILVHKHPNRNELLINNKIYFHYYNLKAQFFVKYRNLVYLWAPSIQYPSRFTRFLCLTCPIASTCAINSSAWQLADCQLNE